MRFFGPLPTQQYHDEIAEPVKVGLQRDPELVAATQVETGNHRLDKEHDYAQRYERQQAEQVYDDKLREVDFLPTIW